MTWTHRDRVLAALNHEEPDRIPIDFGGTSATALSTPAYEELKRHLGLEHETAVMSRIHDLASPDEAILERFDVDTRYLSFGATFGERDRAIDETTFADEWGVVWKKTPQGTSQPVDGPFYGKEPELGTLEE
jgi:uroporphyrinogen decarboxylase